MSNFEKVKAYLLDLDLHIADEDEDKDSNIGHLMTTDNELLGTKGPPTRRGDNDPTDAHLACAALNRGDCVQNEQQVLTRSDLKF